YCDHGTSTCVANPPTGCPAGFPIDCHTGFCCPSGSTCNSAGCCGGQMPVACNGYCCAPGSVCGQGSCTDPCPAGTPVACGDPLVCCAAGSVCGQDCNVGTTTTTIPGGGNCNCYCPDGTDCTGGIDRTRFPWTPVWANEAGRPEGIGDESRERWPGVALRDEHARACRAADRPHLDR